MIDVRGINKDYGNGRGIFDINVSLPKSGIVAVLSLIHISEPTRL